MADNGNSEDKPNVLVLGGVGFIGRNLVDYLVRNDLANKIVVVDKVMPQMAWLNSLHRDSFSKVEFKHANLINPKSVSNVFNHPDGRRYDFVINCAGETKYGQDSTVYKDGIYGLSCNCARESAAHGVRRYVELSTAQMLSSEKPLSEDSSRRLDPWTKLAEQKLEVEKELSTITGLDYVIVRPVTVYGIGDRTGLTPRLIIGGVYKQLQETMQLLWNEDYKTNTVHVRDVAHAIWHLCYHGSNGEVYHLADKGDTTQGKISDIICDIFNIESRYLGSLASNLASKLKVEDVLEDINEKHMAPWGQACMNSNTINTPLTPYVEKEVLLSKQMSIDGRKIEATGFEYIHPHLTKQLLREVLDDYLDMALYPASLVNNVST